MPGRRLTCAFVLQLPIITRYYVTLSFLTTAACALEVRSVWWICVVNVCNSKVLLVHDGSEQHCSGWCTHAACATLLRLIALLPV
jgi:hypothetical protein